MAKNIKYNFKIIDDKVFNWLTIPDSQLSVAFMFKNVNTLGQSKIVKIFIGEIPNNDISVIPEKNFIRINNVHEVFSFLHTSDEFFNWSQKSDEQYFKFLIDTESLTIEHVSEFTHQQKYYFFKYYFDHTDFKEALFHYTRTPYFLYFKNQLQNHCEDCGTEENISMYYNSFFDIVGDEQNNMDKLHIYCRNCSKNHKTNWKYKNEK